MEMEFKGLFKPNPRGFGFVNTDTHGIYVHPRIAKRFFYFDILSGVAESNGDGKWSCVSAKLVEEGARRIAGTIRFENGAPMVVPEISALPAFPVYAQDLTVLQSGDKVVATALQTPQGWAMEVEHVIGNESTPFWESLLSMAMHRIPAEAWNEAVIRNDVPEYEDWTHLPFCTIDAASTQDIDDAVLPVRTENGYRLHVAIADASSYVREGSLLDAYAKERGTTVYFEQRVLPMLPRSVSDEAGSLKPDVNRPAMVCTVDLDSKGSILEVSIVRAWIRSRAKLTYDSVTAFVGGQVDAIPETVRDSISTLHALYETLLEKRVARGSQPIRSGDYSFRLDAQGKPVSIQFKPWHIAYGMIEEAMLCANTGVAGWLISRNVPALYRHHKGPEQQAWEASRPYLESLGMGPIPTEPTPAFLMELSAWAAANGEDLGVTNAILSAMRPASYQVSLPSHFGLAYEHYTHFSSPLRRYADLTVHRILHRVLDGEAPYSVEQVQHIAEQCTLADARAKKATREEAKRLRAEYARTFVNETHTLRLTGGNTAGWFLKSEDPPIETFAPMNTEGSAWEWDSVTQRASHPEYGTVRLGTDIPCRIRGVDMERLRIDAVPVFPLNAVPEVMA